MAGWGRGEGGGEGSNVRASISVCVAQGQWLLTSDGADSLKRDEVGVRPEAGQLVHLIEQCLHLLLCCIVCSGQRKDGTAHIMIVVMTN